MPRTEEHTKLSVSRTFWEVSDSENNELVQSIVMRKRDNGLAILIYKSGKVAFKKLGSKERIDENEKETDMKNHELISKEFDMLFEELTE